MKNRLALLALTAIALSACSPPPTGPAITPDGKTVPSSGKVMSGSVQGAKVGAKTRVALTGTFENLQGADIDALGRPVTNKDALLVSVPVKDGKYAMDLPAVPAGAAAGTFGIVAYNDANDNNTIDAGEDKSAGANSGLVFLPLVGYNVANLGGASVTDALAFDKVNVLFN